jgi:hypothetical protein
LESQERRNIYGSEKSGMSRKSRWLLTLQRGRSINIPLGRKEYSMVRNQTTVTGEQN